MTRWRDERIGSHWRVLAVAMLATLAGLVAQTVIGSPTAAAQTIGRFGDDVVVVLAALLFVLRVVDEPRGRRAPWMLLAVALGAWAFGTRASSCGTGRAPAQRSATWRGWLCTPCPGSPSWLSRGRRWDDSMCAWASTC